MTRLLLASITAGALSGLFLCSAQERPGKKFALLVGVKDYLPGELSKLNFTENDVNDLAAVLRDRLGYRRVVILTQSAGKEEYRPTADNIQEHLKSLLEDCERDDQVLVALSGHGVQLKLPAADGKEKEEAFFCPCDARLSTRKNLIPLSAIYDQLKGCKAGAKLLLVDACREVKERKGAGDDFVPADPPSGVAALYSCRSGQFSFEDADFRHSIFMHYVVEGLKGNAANRRKEITLESLADYLKYEVRDRVKTKLSPLAKQNPELKGEFGSFTLATNITTNLQPTSGDALDFGHGVRLALVRIKAGSFMMGSPDSDKDSFDEEKPQHEVEIAHDFYLGQYEVTRGQFRAFVNATGYTTEAEKDGKGGFGYDAEEKAFFQKTQFNWRDTGFAQSDNHPVVNVTWNDAQAFCEWLTRKVKRTCVLPTEAQREYACRGTTTTRFYHGDENEGLQSVGNIADLSLKASWNYSNLTDKKYQKIISAWFKRVTWDDGYPFTAPVGQFRPNNNRLFDMHGNVWEWCADWFAKDYYDSSPKRDPSGPPSGTLRVLRGGSWDSEPRYCRAAFRLRSGPGYRSNLYGFRVLVRLD